MNNNTALTRINGAMWITPKNIKEILNTGNTLVYFQNTFNLDVTPDDVKLTISLSANNRYKLWINGNRVEQGPCKGDRWRQFYDVIDVSQFLKKGENIIAVEVLYFAPALFRHGKKTGPISIVTNSFGPMLAVKGDIINTIGNIIGSVTTGAVQWNYYIDNAIEWKVFGAGGFMPIGAFESVHSELIPAYWKIKSYKHSWECADDCFEADGSAWGEFSPLPPKERSIPFLYRKEKSFTREMNCSDKAVFSFKKISSMDSEDYLIVPPNTKGFIEIDAGELVTGNLILNTLGGKGSKITILYAESYSSIGGVQYRGKGKRDDCDSMEIFGYQDVFYPSGEDCASDHIDSYEPFWWRTFRFIRLEVETGNSPVQIFNSGYVETGYPLDVKTYISSSCQWIKPLWDISIRTLKRCMHETYEDCPYYEQLQYSLDTRQEIIFTHILSGDTRLGLKAIEDFYYSKTPEGLLQSRAPSDEPNIIPVFSIYWIFMLKDYYWQTGDVEIIKRYKNTVDEILDWFDRHIGNYGMIENLYYWEFVEWAEEWLDENGIATATPKAAKSGPCTTNNLIYAAALKCGAQLMELCDRKSTADDYLNRAESILQNVKQYCWSEENALFREGPNVEEYTEHAQSWAVLSGLVEGEQAKELLKRILVHPDAIRCTFVFSYFMFRALEMTGQYNLSLTQWDKWTNFLDLNITTWPEDLTRQRSDCHAWGAIPIYEFVRCFLGVRPGKPGWETIEIRPICEYIPDMKGIVYTPNGSVEVEWETTEKLFTIKGTCPEGISTQIILSDAVEYIYPNGGTFNISIAKEKIQI